MKKIEAIIKPFKLDGEGGPTRCRREGPDGLKLRVLGAREATPSFTQGAEYVVDFLPKVKIEVVIEDNLAETAVEAIQQAAHRPYRRRKDLRFEYRKFAHPYRGKGAEAI